MDREIILKGRKIKFNLQYKKVKNINLRIKPDGSVNISANRTVSQKQIYDFVISKSNFIINALGRYEEEKNMPRKQYFDENEICGAILGFCKNIYPYFQKFGIEYPQIKFRKMVSQWGNCYFQKGVLTFNTNLMYVPPECIEYVVAHEFTHFLVPNHSKRFYDELSKIMPDWNLRRQKLNTISVR